MFLEKTKDSVVSNMILLDKYAVKNITFTSPIDAIISAQRKGRKEETCNANLTAETGNHSSLMVTNANNATKHACNGKTAQKHV